MHYYAYMQSYLSQNKFAEQCARVGCYNCDINHFCKGPGPHVCEESEKDVVVLDMLYTNLLLI